MERACPLEFPTDENWRSQRESPGEPPHVRASTLGMESPTRCCTLVRRYSDTLYGEDPGMTLWFGCANSQAADSGTRSALGEGFAPRPGCACDPRNFLRDVFRRQDEIDALAGDRAFGHVRFLRRFKLLRDCDPANFSNSAQRVSAVSVLAGHDHGDELSVPVPGERTRKIVITSGQPRGFEIGLRRNSPRRTCRSSWTGL